MIAEDASALSGADVVIVGAGHAGVQLVAALAKHRFAGSVIVISDEGDLPYERPPLSKSYLLGEIAKEDLPFRDAAYWQRSAVQLLCGVRVEQVDPVARTVRTENDTAIGYGTLVWAAGGRARLLTIPGATLPGVQYLRTLGDADALLARMEASTPQSVVVIGGGYIGLETAAALRTRGLNVTVVEAGPRLLARVTGEAIASFMRRRHEEAGVQFRLSETVVELIGDQSVEGVRLGNGALLKANLVIVGIGLVPNVEVLEAAGCTIENGVLVNETLETTVDGIVAIGDCANQLLDAAAGDRRRLESIPNATEQAQVLAARLSHAEPPRRQVPWFWSDQYDIKLKTVGILAGHDREVVRGDPTSGSFSVAYLRGRRLVALDAVNATADFAHAKGLIERDDDIDESLIVDPTVKLKDVAQRDHGNITSK